MLWLRSTLQRYRWPIWLVAMLFLISTAIAAYLMEGDLVTALANLILMAALWPSRKA